MIAVEIVVEIGARQVAKPVMMEILAVAMAVIAAARQRWAAVMFVGIVAAQDLRIILIAIRIAAIVAMALAAITVAGLIPKTLVVAQAIAAAAMCVVTRSALVLRIL